MLHMANMPSFHVSIALTCLFFTAALGQDAYNHFIEPPSVGLAADYSKNQVYELGSTMNITWLSSYTQMTITISQDDSLGTNSNYKILKDRYNYGNTTSYYLWTVTMLPSLSLDRTPVFWLSISQNGKGYFNSHYFNISRQAAITNTMTMIVTQTPDVTSSTVTSTVTSPSSTMSPSTTSSMQPTGTPTTQHGGESSNPLKLGLGLGIGLGVPLLLALIALLVLACYTRRHRKHKMFAAPTRVTSLWEKNSASSILSKPSA